MPSLSTYAVFLATAMVLLAVPGPAVLYVVTRSIEMGRAGGLASVAGIATGTIVHIALATAGLSSLILASHVAFGTVRYVAFIPQFVDPGVRRVWLQVLVLGLSFACLGFLSDSVYAFAAGTVADRLRGSRGIARLQRWFGGSALIGLGIVVAAWSPSAGRSS